MGFMCTETTVICFAVLWRVVHALAVGFGLSLQFATSLRYFCFCLRHWVVIDYTLPVKMCGTHLGVIMSVVSIGSVSHLLRCASHTLGWERYEFCSWFHGSVVMSDSTISADWVIKLPSMPKLYLGPGLSQRVHRALSLRLERFMANTANPTQPEFPLAVNPPLTAQASGMESEPERDEQSSPHQEEGNKSPVDKEEREEDRSRSPRIRVRDPDPNSPADILASSTTLAIGITSMVAALKNSSEKLEILIKNSQTLQQDLCRSLETVGTAVSNMSRAVESLTAGVSYNTSRVGAVCGEYTKLKKHLRVGLGQEHERGPERECQDQVWGRKGHARDHESTVRSNGQDAGEHAISCLSTWVFADLNKPRESARVWTGCTTNRAHGSATNGTNYPYDTGESGTHYVYAVWHFATVTGSTTVGATHGANKECGANPADTSCGVICRLQPCQNWRTAHDPCGADRDDRTQESTLSSYRRGHGDHSICFTNQPPWSCDWNRSICSIGIRLDQEHEWV